MKKLAGILDKFDELMDELDDLLNLKKDPRSWRIKLSDNDIKTLQDGGGIVFAVKDQEITVTKDG
jgi:hypothetical protein